MKSKKNMKKSSDHPSDPAFDDSHPDEEEDLDRPASTNDGKSPLQEISTRELDNIFFPEKQKGETANRPSSLRSDLKELNITAGPDASGGKPSQGRPMEIHIESATPIPTSREDSRKKKADSPPVTPVKIPVSSLELKEKQKRILKQGFLGSPPMETAEKMGTDITRDFVPASRIDEKGNILAPEKQEDTTAVKKKEKSRKKTGPLYTILLALGRPIHFKKTIEICSEFLKIPPEAAERRIRFGKGILFEHVDRDSALYLQDRFLSISQGIKIAQENILQLIPEPEEILVWLFSRRHFQVQTEKEKLVLPWEGVQLVCAGSVRLQAGAESYKKILDIIMTNPLFSLRIWDTTFDYKKSGITNTTVGEKNFLNLSKVLLRFAQKAKISPTLQEMVDRDLNESNHFESLEEFENYTRWLYLSYFAKPV